MKLTRLLAGLPRLHPTTRLRTIPLLHLNTPTQRLMATNVHTNGAASKQNGPRTNLIPSATRLKDGRALAQDVWSIYKCVPRISLLNLF